MSMTLELIAERVAVLEKQMAALMGDKALDVSDSKPKKEKKSKKPNNDSSDEDKPKKKRVSGYILFSKATRDEVKADMIEKDSDAKPKNTDIMCELAKLWKALSDEGRDEWNAKAKELKDASE